MANIATGNNAALPNGAQAGVVLSATVDFSKDPLDATSVHNVINIPAGTWVYKTSVRVIEASTESSTRTFTVGDSADDDGYATATSTKTVAHAIGGGAFAAGKFYATASTIDLTSVEALGEGVVEVRALCFAM